MSTELVMLSISSSVAPFSFCLQYFPASGSFPMSLLFTSGGQSIRVSASVLPMNIQSWFPLALTGLISLQVIHNQPSWEKPLSNSCSLKWDHKELLQWLLVHLHGQMILKSNCDFDTDPLLQKKKKRTNDYHLLIRPSVQFSSVSQSCPTLWTPWITSDPR